MARKRDDGPWPEGYGSVSETGYCDLHRSHFCPCAQPSLYDVGRSSTFRSQRKPARLYKPLNRKDVA